MVPPVQVGVAGVQAPPLPMILKAPVPVAFKTMPLEGFVLLPVTLMLRNVNPLAPIVLETLRAVPVVDAIVLTIVELSCVALTVAPLPVALKPTPEVVVRLR